MTEVIQFPEKKRQVYEYETCAGCHEAVRHDKEYVEITLPMNRYDKHIILCSDCSKTARGYGAF